MGEAIKRPKRCGWIRCAGFGALGFLAVLGIFVVWVHSQTGDDGPVVDGTIDWIDTVRSGPLPVQVHGLGKVVRAEGSEALFVRIRIPASQSEEVRVGQKCEVDTRRGFVDGRVEWTAANPVGEFRDVDIGLEKSLPIDVGEDSDVDGTITIKTLQNVVYVGRPVHGEPYSTGTLFKYTDDSRSEAVRVYVEFGEASVNAIQILAGLKPGDNVILSDMSMWDGMDRIKTK